MSRESFRFIHAGEFHLERPLADLPDLPDHLKAAIVSAAYTAVDRLVETAIAENVDFLVLCGDLLHPVAAGAWGVSYLLEKFELLATKKIQVYWVTGSADAQDRWPDAVPLPDNVKQFSDRQSEAVQFRRGGVPLATIVGRSCDGRRAINAAEYHFDDDELFRIAMAYGEADADSLRGERIDYWALGGEHQRRRLSPDAEVYYCGTVQGRGFDEPEAHGGYLIEVEGGGNARVRAIDCDVFRYSRQTIDEDDMAVSGDIRGVMSKRVQKIIGAAGSRHTLVEWLVQMDLANAAVVGPAALEELLGWLRREFGHGSSCCWSTDLAVLPPKALPAKWLEEDTILGDFLRTAAEARKGREPLDVTGLIEVETPGSLQWKSQLAAPADDRGGAAYRAELDLATLAGVDLLRGQGVDLLSCTRRFGHLIESRQS